MHHHSDHCHHHTLVKANTSSPKVKLLLSVLILVGCFSVTELAIGLWSNSLALLADSGHMVSDTFAIGLTLFATWLSDHNSQKTTSKYHLIEIIAALINGIGLVATGDKPPLALTHFGLPGKELLVYNRRRRKF